MLLTPLSGRRLHIEQKGGGGMLTIQLSSMLSAKLGERGGVVGHWVDNAIGLLGNERVSQSSMLSALSGCYTLCHEGYPANQPAPL